MHPRIRSRRYDNCILGERVQLKERREQISYRCIEYNNHPRARKSSPQPPTYRPPFIPPPPRHRTVKPMHHALRIRSPHPTPPTLRTRTGRRDPSARPASKAGRCRMSDIVRRSHQIATRQGICRTGHLWESRVSSEERGTETALRRKTGREHSPSPKGYILGLTKRHVVVLPSPLIHATLGTLDPLPQEPMQPSAH